MLNYVIQSGCAVLELDHPPVNVLSMSLLEELRGALARAADGDVRAVLLRGTGRNFSAGADVAEHLPGKVERMMPLFCQTMLDLASLELPTVCYVHGWAMGGGFELALACDFIVAADDARFSLPEISLGVFPPFAAVRLPALVGHARALELLLTGDMIGAKRAMELGLVARTGPPEEAMKFVELLVRHPRSALAACKRAANAPVAERLAEAQQIYLQDLMSRPEPIEGLGAFLEKRPPRWRNA
ncbi:MAG: enoyl-CoA hydratase/isomerase family protein [Planctomycetes bacterium]|nr:enoyl-CoA hydratase/isomerase family protein [Planctomycetota bacterium]